MCKSGNHGDERGHAGGQAGGSHKRGRAGRYGKGTGQQKPLGAGRAIGAAAVCAAAAAAATTASLSAAAPDANEASRATLRRELIALGLPDARADAVLAGVSVSRKGSRCSVRATLPSEATLPALLPLLRSFPHVTWAAEAHDEHVAQEVGHARAAAAS